MFPSAPKGDFFQRFCFPVFVLFWRGEKKAECGPFPVKMKPRGLSSSAALPLLFQWDHPGMAKVGHGSCRDGDFGMAEPEIAAGS